MSGKVELKSEQLSKVVGGDDDDLMREAADSLKKQQEEQLRKQLEDLQNQQTTRNSEELRKEMEDILKLLNELTGGNGTGPIVVVK